MPFDKQSSDFKKRTRGKDKKKNTFNRYGKNTSKGVRINKEKAENSSKKK